MANIGYIQVTRECNQACIICSNPPNNGRLSYEKAKEWVDDLKSRKNQEVILTGGEPTLYVRLPDLISYCIKQDMVPRIITNGQRISDMVYLQTLKDAGLKHLHLSVYSCYDGIQSKISQNKNSLRRIQKALTNLEKIGGITVDINITINKYNADHLCEVVNWLMDNYPFVRHFVFNNLDPQMNRATDNPQVIPRLNDFELDLHRALESLESNKKTFRVERVPLCYLGGYEHVSTETRKIVKKEGRIIFFLDKRGQFVQDVWSYRKADCCQYCSLDKICAGIYSFGKQNTEEELYPVFIDPQMIVKKVLKNQ